MLNPQLNRHGELRHLLSTEGLPRSLLHHILDIVHELVPFAGDARKTQPLLRGKSVFTLFFEDAAGSRAAFEAAALRLSADFFNIDIGAPGAARHGVLPGIVGGLDAMPADLLIVRHPDSGAANLIAGHAPAHLHVINAGDGWHAHPVRALLDMYTIRRRKPDFTSLVVALVGDAMHSSVARSDIHALTTLGVPEVRMIAPRTLLPPGLEQLGVRVFTDLREGLTGVDAVIALELRGEHANGSLLPSAREYFKHYGLTREMLAVACPDAVVIHADPEDSAIETDSIDSTVADGARAAMPERTVFGLAVRMAALSLIADTRP